MGTTVEPLYFMSQLRDVCLNRDEWDYDGKSARLLGSRCLGNQHMQDILGRFSKIRNKKSLQEIFQLCMFFDHVSIISLYIID